LPDHRPLQPQPGRPDPQGGQHHRSQHAGRTHPGRWFPAPGVGALRRIGVDRARAELKSRFLSTFAADVIRAEFPRLGEQMTIRTAVLDWRSRTLEAIAKEKHR
jgi:hypothetical protein